MEMRIIITSFLVLSACQAGQGDGWIVGSVNVENCRQGDPLQNFEKFDLNINFFAGDLLTDGTEVPEVKRNGLTVRLQATSNTVEQTDGVLIQFHNLATAAKLFAQGNPIPLLDENDELLMRSQLHLFNSCPENQSPLIASAQYSVDDFENTLETCKKPQLVASLDCPLLSDEDKKDLQKICAEEFEEDSTRHFDTIQNILGGGACLYFCEMGTAKFGQALDTLDEFNLEYGENIAAIFSFKYVDSRAVELDECSHASAQLNGMFRFEIVRSRVAQPFP